ncbi:MAG: hypothetical protein VKN56_11510 [Cyanobacteriota bacterium]|nr:hypothetical protein [Cyanobacteriota bacterium]
MANLAGMESSFWPSFLPEASLLQSKGEERRKAGQAHFAEVLMALLHPVTHPQLRELAEWACAETGTLHTSQISLMRNNKTRMLGTKVIDALGRLNQLAWVAARHPELLPLAGCAPLTPRIQRLLEAYKPLLDPVSQEPLGSGALLEIYLGLRRQPISRPRSLSLAEAGRLAERLGDWLEAELRARDWSFREAGRRLQRLWEGEAAGARRLVRVLAGLEDYTAKQVADGWERIARALLSLLDRKPDIWALADELLARDLQVEPETGVPLVVEPDSLASALVGPAAVAPAPVMPAIKARPGARSGRAAGTAQPSEKTKPGSSGVSQAGAKGGATRKGQAGSTGRKGTAPATRSTKTTETRTPPKRGPGSTTA